MKHIMETSFQNMNNIKEDIFGRYFFNMVNEWQTSFSETTMIIQ